MLLSGNGDAENMSEGCACTGSETCSPFPSSDSKRSVALLQICLVTTTGVNNKALKVYFASCLNYSHRSCD
jgi:hypothetical protein